MKKISNLLFLALLSFFAYQNLFNNKAEADAKTSYKKLNDGKAIFIDVREESEINNGMIKGAHWISLSSIENDKIGQIEKIKKLSQNKEIFLYCRSGARASIVKSDLEKAGIKSLNLGGYQQLTEDGLESKN